VHSADELMAKITAERLVEYLVRAGYMVMCKPPERTSTESPGTTRDGLSRP
jgi:hypothetical protein